MPNITFLHIPRHLIIRLSFQRSALLCFGFVFRFYGFLRRLSVCYRHFLSLQEYDTFGGPTFHYKSLKLTLYNFSKTLCGQILETMLSGTRPPTLIRHRCYFGKKVFFIHEILHPNICNLYFTGG